MNFYIGKNQLTGIRPILKQSTSGNTIICIFKVIFISHNKMNLKKRHVEIYGPPIHDLFPRS